MGPRISRYVFGRITIDGTEHSSDVIVYPDRVEGSWWREKGHLLQPADLAGLAEEKPGVLVIGTGSRGAMKVPPETMSYLEGIAQEVRVLKTADAVEFFNSISEGTRAVAALHLTC